MHIIVDARYANDNFPGIGRYVYNLLDALGQIESPHSFAALYNPELRNTRHDIGALARHATLELVPTRLRPFGLGEQRWLAGLLRDLRADLFHAPYYVRPYTSLPCPSVTTLYDAIPRLFPGEVSVRARLLFNLLTRLAVRGSQQILAISASARDDLTAAYGIPRERISVTPLAADPRFVPQPPAAVAAIRAHYQLPEPYILCVSSNKPHKNLPSLVEAYETLLRQREPGWRSTFAGLQLVIAGHWDPRYPEARQAAERLGLGQRVRFLHSVAEADLPALYSGAEVFAFPSRYEGFGLPPLEAMACGAPVVCGNRSSLPEVVGNSSAGTGPAAALLVDPTATALAKGLARVLDDPGLQEYMRAAGPAHAAQFSWRATAAATLAVYELAARPQSAARRKPAQ